MNNYMFFKKRKNIFISEIFDLLNINKIKIKAKINDIKDLSTADINDVSFFNSAKYLEVLKKSKVKFVITNDKYKTLIEKYCFPIVVKDVFVSVAQVTKLFYPDSLNDSIDYSLSKPNLNKFKKIVVGKNVLFGKNVSIGKNTHIGHNTIIESNVRVGSNCIIGSNVLIKYSIIGNNVRILDGAVVGKKGFGFLPQNNLNYRYPHIGLVIIEDNVEIGCNNTIDRGSLSNTIIGKNTFLDNQVHIAHNVNIGKNCVVTAQVGFAGSAVIGNKVMIGGQAGISGHLKVGDNVQIGGGSGVLKNIPDNSKVMGYPAKDIRIFLRDNKKK